MTLDEELVEALQRDYTTAPISEQDRVMLDYVATLTRDATKIHRKITTGCARQASTTGRSCKSR